MHEADKTLLNLASLIATHRPGYRGDNRAFDPLIMSCRPARYDAHVLWAASSPLADSCAVPK